MKPPSQRPHSARLSGTAKRFGPIHDVIHFYRKSPKYKHRAIFRPYAQGHVDGYFKQKDDKGKYWTNSVHGAGTRNGESGKTWRGYNPTAAGRHWAVPGDLVEMLGIDEDLPQHEKLDALADMGVIDLPTTLEGAKLLATQDKIKKAFEIWCVSTLDGYPNEKKGADKGVDGRIKFRPGGMKGPAKYAIVSVKSGHLKPDDVRSLIAVAAREKASSLGFGILVSLENPTAKMKAEANDVPMIEVAGVKYPAIQLITVDEMLHGKRPKLPFYDPTATYKKAKAHHSTSPGLFDEDE